TGSAAGNSAHNLVDAVPLPDGKSVLWDRTGKGWVVQDTRSGGGVQRVDLGLADGAMLTVRPAAFAGGLLAPVSSGSVWLLDAATGDALNGSTPFQPETRPGAKVRWLPPLVIDERQFVAVDASRKSIYVARYEEKPKPFLAQSRAQEVDYEPAHAAVIGKTLL